MATKKLIQLEFDKFQVTGAGEVAIRTISITPTPAFGQLQMSGSIQQLTDNPLNNGVILQAKTTNGGDIMLGGSSVSLTEDGTGNGFILEPGASITFACQNTSEIYAIGTSGDVLSFAGS